MIYIYTNKCCVEISILKSYIREVKKLSVASKNIEKYFIDIVNRNYSKKENYIETIFIVQGNYLGLEKTEY